MPVFVWIFVSSILDVWQDSPQDGACFSGHRLERSEAPVLVVGRQSTESWSKRLSSFQTIWGRGSGSEWILDSMWCSILHRYRCDLLRVRKEPEGSFCLCFLPWGRTTLEPQQTYMITNVVLIDLQRRHFRSLSPQETISTLKTSQYILVLLK